MKNLGLKFVSLLLACIRWWVVSAPRREQVRERIVTASLSLVGVPPTLVITTPDITSSVAVRVRGLAEVRTAEGYMAEARPDGDDMLLVEHHCPVCEAASSCQGLCAGELALFRSVLGDDVTVERESHILRGDGRCAYRVSAAR